MAIYYYYCDFSTFQSMLNAKTLWLTDLTRSNDSEEVLRAYRILWERVKTGLRLTDLPKDILNSQIEILDSVFQIQSITDIPYGCCFCADDDLPHLWNEYANRGKGVALGFDLDAINGLHKQYPITSALISHSLGYEAVIYDSDVLVNHMIKLLYSAIQGNGYQAALTRILPTFKHYASFIKNPTFRDERETRIVFYPSDKFEDSLDNLSQLESDTINTTGHYNLGWFYEGVSALKSVKIGFDCDVECEKIQQMIKEAGIESQIDILKSHCSYRARQH